MIMAVDTLSQTQILNHPHFAAHVARCADRAHECLPGESARIDRAVALVLSGCVEEDGPGRYAVASASSHNDTWYMVQNNACTCPDFRAHASTPDFYCKHVIATWIYRRTVQEIEKEEIMIQGMPNCRRAGKLGIICCQQCTDCTPAEDCWAEFAAQAAPVPAPVNLPEAPASINCTVCVGGQKLMITIRDTDEERAMERMRTLLAKYAAK